MSTCNVPQAAEILKVHENRVMQLIDRGDLPAAKIGRAWVMMERDVLAYVERQIAEQTACRPGELAGCMVGDLDPAGLLTVSGKTGRRTIPISPKALALLKSAAGDRDLDEPLLTRSGVAWTRFEWRDAFQEARRAAGLAESVVMYSLRHVAISEMLVAGIDPMTVSKIAGTSIAMISSNYGHLIKERVVEQLARVKAI